MNSIKTAFVSLVLLGVLYGMYQVLNTPQPEFDENGLASIPEAPAIETGEAIDPLQLLSADELNPSGPVIETPETAPPLVGDTETTGEFNTDIHGRFGTDSTPQPLAEAGGGFVRPTEPLNETGGGFAPEPSIGTTPPESLPAPPTNAIADNSQFQPTPNTPSELTPSGSNTTSDFQNQSRQGFVDSALSPRSQDEITDADFARRLGTSWTQVENLIDQQKFAEALQELSYYYGDSRLAPEEQDNMLTWLDALAAKVIYSTEHHEGEAYIVSSTDTLAAIAQAHGVTEELLYNINQSRFSEDGGLFAGLELKIVKGPFHALIDRSENTLTLFAGQRYAGRFDLTTPSIDAVAPGSYSIISRSDGSAANVEPYGSHVLMMSNGVAIQESRQLDASAGKPVVGLATMDMYDVYSILSQESVVTVVD